jgi:hypothetical protein
MHQGLTVDVAFGKGSVRDPTAFSLLIPYRYNWPLAVLMIAFLNYALVVVDPCAASIYKED